jgi:hypothetical protein
MLVVTLSVEALRVIFPAVKVPEKVPTMYKYVSHDIINTDSTGPPVDSITVRGACINGILDPLINSGIVTMEND